MWAAQQSFRLSRKPCQPPANVVRSRLDTSDARANAGACKPARDATVRHPFEKALNG